MNNCKYELTLEGNVFKFSSNKELTKFILENKVGKIDKVKFSTSLNDRQAAVKSAIESPTEATYKAFKGKDVYEFLKQTHDLGNGPVLLTPYFDNVKYVENKIKVEKEKDDSIDEVRMKKELLEELNEADKMQNFGITMHSLAHSALLMGSAFDPQIQAQINYFIDGVEKYNQSKKASFLYTAQEKEIFRKSIAAELQKFMFFADNLGFTGVIQPYLTNSGAELKSKPDVVIIDESGDPHILDVTISRKRYGNWDSAKVANSDYKLAIQRQMLQSLCPVDRGSVYVIPFLLPEGDNGILELKEFSYTAPVKRDNEPHMNYNGGKYSNNLKKLIPSDLTELHIRNEFDADSAKLIDAMIPKSYSFRSKFVKSDKEALIKKIKEGRRNDGTYILIDNLSDRVIPIEKEEDIEKHVDKYIEEFNASKNSETYKLKTTLKAMMHSKEKAGIKYRKGSAEAIVNLTFQRFLDGDWELIDNDIFSNQDMLVFKNNRYNTIEVVGLTANYLTNISNLGLGNTLLGKYRNNAVANADKRILPATTSNIESIKMLSILNNIPEIFDGYTLSNIKVLNYITDNKSDSENLDNLIYNFNQLYKIINKDGTLGIPNNFSSGKIKKSDFVDVLYREILYTLGESKNSNLKSLAYGTREDYKQNKLDWLIRAKQSLIKEYPDIALNPEKIPTGYGEEKYNLLQLLDYAISYSIGMKFSFDAIVPQLGIRFSDIGHLPQTILFGEGREYDKNGKRVVGFLQGSYFNTTDSLVSKDRTQINDYISLGHTKIREAYQKVQGKTVAKTNEFYANSGRLSVEKTLIGNAAQFHNKLFKTVPNSDTLSDKFIVKNPYDLSENLKDYERDYLKYILWELWKFKGLIAEEHKDVDYKDAVKLSEFQEYLKTPAYLEIPLMKKLDLNKWGSLTTDSFRDTIGKRWEEFKDSIDPRNITDLQRENAEKESDACKKMYNEFKMDENLRKNIITEYGVNYFETNLDTLLLKYAFASIRENVMDKVLVIINSAMGVLKHYGYQAGISKDMEAALDESYKQFRIAIYGIEPFKGEVTEALAVVKQVQKAASIMFITMRPILMFKELITGTFKNVSYAWTKVYGDSSFTISDLASAYNKVLFSKMQSIGDFTITDNLNQLYGVANMDTNSMVKKTKADRSGLFKFFSEHMYWMNTAPDYVNRLTLFVAKMIHDGCYDAHYIDSNGNFKYDAKKDKRFEIYFAKRAQYNFKFAENDPEYNNQRSLYLSVLQSVNKENKLFTGKVLNEKTDILEKAYTHEDRESIKVFADMAYGFYDHERSSLWKHTVMGSIFGQFLTYWPSKVKYYFGKEIESKTGQWEQKYEQDPDGNKQLIWLEDRYDEDGNLDGTQETLTNTGIPAKHFVKGIHEGLAYSLGLCLRDLKNGNLSKTPEERKRRAMLAIHDLLMGLLLAAFVRVLLEDFEEVENKSVVDQAMQGTTRAFYKATKEFDPFASVFTAFKWEPAFVGMSSTVASSFMDLFSGSSSMEKFMRSNFKMLESIPEITE